MNKKRGKRRRAMKNWNKDQRDQPPHIPTQEAKSELKKKGDCSSQAILLPAQKKGGCTTSKKFKCNKSTRVKRKNKEITHIQTQEQISLH
ncbi:hypothetical protein JTB14_009374 [Gonioctena quinquepunctata]|nr:hypothetical protein JTB14_009374 [Gonioctena quinquepunctata]